MKNGRRVKNTKRNSSNRSKSKVLDISIIIYRSRYYKRQEDFS